MAGWSAVWSAAVWSAAAGAARYPGPCSDTSSAWYVPCAYQPCTQTRTGVEPPVKWMVSCAYVPLVPGVQVLTSPVEVPDAPRNTNAPRTQAVSV